MGIRMRSGRSRWSSVGADDDRWRFLGAGLARRRHCVRRADSFLRVTTSEFFDEVSRDSLTVGGGRGLHTGCPNLSSATRRSRAATVRPSDRLARQKIDCPVFHCSARKIDCPVFRYVPSSGPVFRSFRSARKIDCPVFPRLPLGPVFRSRALEHRALHWPPWWSNERACRKAVRVAEVNRWALHRPLCWRTDRRRSGLVVTVATRAS